MVSVHFPGFSLILSHLFSSLSMYGSYKILCWCVEDREREREEIIDRVPSPTRATTLAPFDALVLEAPPQMKRGRKARKSSVCVYLPLSFREKDRRRRPRRPLLSAHHRLLLDREQVHFSP